MTIYLVTAGLGTTVARCPEIKGLAAVTPVGESGTGCGLKEAVAGERDPSFPALEEGLLLLAGQRFPAGLSSRLS